MRSIRLHSWIERLLGLDPLRVPPYVFAVDEGSLRYGRFECGGDGTVMADYRAVELPPGFFHSGPLGGPLSKPEALGEKLAELLDHLDDEERKALGRASLVIPDRWLRLVFAEITELPSSTAARDEVLRFKLRRLVPFRVEELRVRALEVAPLRGQNEPRRVLLGFAIDLLLTQLERAFAAAGTELGQISNTSLSLAELLRKDGASSACSLLVCVQEEGYSLLFLADGEPLLYRYKALESGLEEEQARALVARELRLTKSFLEDQAPEARLDRVVLAAEPSQQGAWLGHLGLALDCVPALLDEDLLALASSPSVAATAAEWPGSAALLGASIREVA